MNVLDLFSGIGGFSLGLERAGFETVAFCEIDPYCRAVLRKHWPEVPCYPDVRELTADRLASDGIGPVDVVCGGFPCQPWSVAGKRRGQDDDRDLWPEMWRVIGELRPRWVVGENVPGLDDAAGLGLDRVLSDLEGLNYEVGPPLEIPACAVGAPHIRRRLWIMAYAERCGQLGANECNGEYNAPRQAVRQPAENDGQPRKANGEQRPVADSAKSGSSHRGGETIVSTGAARRIQPKRLGGDVADTPSPRSQVRDGLQPCGQAADAAAPAFEWWLSEPDVGRVAHGVPSRVDRLRALGNAVVPQIPEIIGRAILDADREVRGAGDG